MLSFGTEPIVCSQSEHLKWTALKYSVLRVIPGSSSAQL